jgi:intracellular sulfur oxidation DsrE/DsrF family protein
MISINSMAKTKGIRKYSRRKKHRIATVKQMMKLKVTFAVCRKKFSTYVFEMDKVITQSTTFMTARAPIIRVGRNFTNFFKSWRENAMGCKQFVALFLF